MINRVTLIVPVELLEPGAGQPSHVLGGLANGWLAAQLAAALATAAKVCARLPSSPVDHPGRPRCLLARGV
ncbi:MAG TPA: hypothetical protein DHU96_26460 [Actinobacteria bacterium]|nr:hypothetical protein [Actinomycetota bacterium]